MATARRGGQVDEEFLHQLYRGGELLAAGKVIEAKEHLEKAHNLQPKNEKGQNLLGLTYFKLGLFDRAAEIYELLVRENPADPTLRVNLGLVYLKANALPRAIREFETATDLAPDHKKAHNYLGLALAQAGEYGRAKDHFIQAGSEAMAEKMDRAIAGEQVLKPIASPAARRGFAEIEGSEVVAERGGEVPQPAEDEIRIQQDVPPSTGAQPAQDWGEAAATVEAAPVPAATPVAAAASGGDDDMKFAEDEGPSAPAEDMSPRSKAQDSVAEVTWEETPAQSFPALTPEAEAEEQPVIEVGATEEAPAVAAAEPPAMTKRRAPQLAPSGEVGALEKTAPSLAVFQLPLEEPFKKVPEGVVVRVAGELLIRLNHCVAVAGGVTFLPENKKNRGRSTDKPFGEGARHFVRAHGSGAVLLSAGKRPFEVVDLGDDSAYFRDEVLAAFEESIMFENGRVPSELGAELDLVHLRGTGRALLVLEGKMRSLEVKMDRPAVVPLEKLVGWVGALTPRITELWRDPTGKPTPTGVELSGEGFVLFSVPDGA